MRRSARDKVIGGRSTSERVIDALEEYGAYCIAAGKAGIGLKTLERMRAEDDGFGEACERARAEFSSRQAKRILDDPTLTARDRLDYMARTLGGTWLPARQATELTGANGGPVQTVNVSMAEVQKRLTSLSDAEAAAEYRRAIGADSNGGT